MKKLLTAGVIATSIILTASAGGLSQVQKQLGFAWDYTYNQKVAPYPIWFNYYIKIVAPGVGGDVNYLKSCQQTFNDNMIDYGVSITRRTWKNMMVNLCG